jgi:hypothetical protein
VPKIRISRLVVLILASALAGMAILSLGHNPGPFPKTWIELAAVLGVLVTVSVGLWAARKNRVSLGLVLILVGNALCSGAILLPLTIEHRSWVLTSGVSFYVLSLVARLIKLAMLIVKQRASGSGAD